MRLQMPLWQEVKGLNYLRRVLLSVSKPSAMRFVYCQFLDLMSQLLGCNALDEVRGNLTIETRSLSFISPSDKQDHISDYQMILSILNISNAINKFELKNASSSSTE